MPTAQLTAGTIDYTDSGGDGPVLVLLHGVNMDASLWQDVVRALGPSVRCICPTLPLGSHARPMRRPELVTHRGVAAMVAELLEALELTNVTLVLNDWGGAQFLLVGGGNQRIGRAVLVACEAFHNFPPGRPGKAIAASARMPALLWLAMQFQRFRWFRRAPGGWGWMSKRPVAPETMDRWFRPAQENRLIRRDLRTFALSTPPPDELDRLTAGLPGFDRPVLVVWATEDRMMPREHGPALARLFPRGELVEVSDSYTLVPIDQPRWLASLLWDVVHPAAGDDRPPRGSVTARSATSVPERPQR